jgi:hypothetical protein
MARQSPVPFDAVDNQDRKKKFDECQDVGQADRAASISANQIAWVETYKPETGTHRLGEATQMDLPLTRAWENLCCSVAWDVCLHCTASCRILLSSGLPCAGDPGKVCYDRVKRLDPSTGL